MNFSKKNYEIKKHPKANLENYSKLFVQLGLVLSLFVVYLLIQNKTFNNEISTLTDSGSHLIDNTPPMIELKIEPEKVTQPKQKQILVDIKQEKNDADIDETLYFTPDIDAPFDQNTLVEVPKEVIIDPKDDFFDITFLEEAPLFPGCKGTNEERKACFSEEIAKYINKKFNNQLAGELGLTPGIQRIYTQFKIDKNGNVIDIEARAPHKRLQDEAIRVISLLPKMKPGKQQGKPIKVRYAVPIAFKVE
ncbi:energy transducer TonB [Lutibacter sp.]|uniref:energy transducer TonB n=1 Tax=Lutibacter sp. TaxID=1925666 RepID=UPI001A206452|nr:energy transducer TonB [Lutibacter sp.]MBI9040447.1 energy transducer TonB [Lutibacter sp.]